MFFSLVWSFFCPLPLWKCIAQVKYSLITFILRGKHISKRGIGFLRLEIINTFFQLHSNILTLQCHQRKKLSLKHWFYGILRDNNDSNGPAFLWQFFTSWAKLRSLKISFFLVVFSFFAKLWDSSQSEHYSFVNHLYICPSGL